MYSCLREGEKSETQERVIFFMFGQVEDACYGYNYDVLAWLHG